MSELKKELKKELEEGLHRFVGKSNTAKIRDELHDTVVRILWRHGIYV